jgi:hypothetical protein
MLQSVIRIDYMEAMIVPTAWAGLVHPVMANPVTRLAIAGPYDVVTSGLRRDGKAQR